MLYTSRYMGWHMVFEADNLREATAIGRRNVDGFGGIVGVDIPTVRPATADDVEEYRAMGGRA